MNYKIFSVVLIVIFSLSCGRQVKSNKIQSDFSFKIPQTDIYITTSKRVNAKFFVMFSRGVSVSSITDTISYIECETMNSDIIIIIDLKENNNIYITYPNIKKINKSNFNLFRLTEDQLDTMFYKKRIATQPPILKNPYEKILIMPATYTIILQKDSSFKNQIKIKGGNINGGW